MTEQNDPFARVREAYMVSLTTESNIAHRQSAMRTAEQNVKMLLDKLPSEQIPEAMNILDGLSYSNIVNLLHALMWMVNEWEDDDDNPVIEVFDLLVALPLNKRNQFAALVYNATQLD